MNKIEENYTSLLWNTKCISDPDEDWFISKIFKTKRQMLPIQEQRKIIEKKKQYFWEYIPETILCEIWDWEGYVIKQKFIKWKTLAQTDISSLSANTLYQIIDLIKKYIKYFKEEWWDMDTTWYQIYKWNVSNLERRLRQFLAINKNFLTSSNIMVSDDWNVYIVDICESSDFRLLWKIKNFCAKPFIKRTISNLEKVLQRRIIFENDGINRELINTLNG